MSERQEQSSATPRERFETDCRRADFVRDAAQAAVVRHTQRVYEELTGPAPRRGLWDRLRRRYPVPVRGLYLWGGVGRGKTYLMDGLYRSLPFPHKRRVHFHRFMGEVHHRLQRLPRNPDPLVVIARGIAEEVRVVCLDEFHVHDIGDAMLLGGLLAALFAHGVTLVTTANVAPDGLYRNGLQRQRFLPAIGLIKRHTEVVELAVTFPTVFLSGVPIMEPRLDAAARRFVHLVDAFYDHGVKLVVAAAAPPEDLYAGRHLEHEFRRTTSRLREMASHSYLARPHRAAGGGA